MLTHVRSRSRSRPLSVLVADPNALARAGLCAILGQDPRFRVAPTGERDLVSEVLRHAPDLLILDPARDEDGGVRRVEAIVQAARSTHVCVYTDAMSELVFLALMRAGARGCFLKEQTDVAWLGDVLPIIGHGHMVCAEPRLLDRLIEWSRDRKPAAVARCDLPPREWAVLRELAAGASDKAIAARLETTCSTVRTHVARLRNRFAADSRAQLVVNAIKAGALTP